MRLSLLWCGLLGIVLAGCGAATTTARPVTATSDTARFIVARESALWRLNLPSTDLLPLLDVGPLAAASHPALSPDGTQLVYAYRPPIPTPSADEPFVVPRTDLYRTTLSGGIGTPIHTALEGYDSIDQPVWSPDATIIYAHYQTLRFAPDGTFIGSGDDIMSVSLATGTITTIITDAAYPAPSPDGTMLAFVRNPVDQPAILSLYDRASGGERVLVRDPSITAMEAPIWSADGTTIYFSGSPLNPPTGGSLPPPLRWFAASTASAHGLGWQVWMADVDTGASRALNTQTFEDPRLVQKGDRLYLWTFTGLWQLNLQTPTTPPTLILEPGDITGIAGVP